MNKRVIFLVITLLISVSLLGACNTSDDAKSGTSNGNGDQTESNLTESGHPIVKEKITLDFFTGKSHLNLNEDWNDLMLWNEYEEMTNIEINWVEQVSQQELPEKRNLTLAGNQLPDVFYASSFSNLDLYKYGQQGVFIELNDLIEEHMPHLNKYLEENPDVRKGITFPDGNIYSLPTVVEDGFLSRRIAPYPWFNREWLENLGMDVPETTEEYYQYLKAVKEDDPNGNGENDEIPHGGVNIDNLFNWLKGSFGIGKNGSSNYYELDPNGEDIRFIPTSEDYKELLTYMNMLYEEELIQPNIFSIEWAQFMAMAGEGAYGHVVHYEPSATFGVDLGEDYFVGGSALEGPNGDRTYANIGSALASAGNFVITNENPDPIATARWMDFFYSDEGSRFIYMGIENETYEVTDDGEYVYIDEIENSAERDVEISKYLPWVGVNPAGLSKLEYFQGSEGSPKSIEVTEKIEPYLPDVVWSNFTYTEEENTFLTSVGADIEKYVDEMRDKFISGDTPLSEWDNYVQTIEGIGLEDYLEIQTAAYERYLSN